MEQKEFLERLDSMSVHLDNVQIEQFQTYYELLSEWNSFMNLTAITDYSDVLTKHFLDSLAVRKAVESLRDTDENLSGVLDLNKNINIIDVGTGAGFPGIPLKIAFPRTQVMLIDALNKRVKFLEEVIGRLGLKDIKAVHARAEEAARRQELRESFTLCVSRAVAGLSTLAEYDLPFVRTGGYFVAYKSGEVEEEAEKSEKAIAVLGGKMKHIYKCTLPGTDIDRSFVFIQKIRPTPKKYPRKSGMPGKDPIK